MEECQCFQSPQNPLAVANYTQVQQTLVENLSFVTAAVTSISVTPIANFTRFVLTPGIWNITYSFSFGPFNIPIQGTVNSYLLVNRNIWNTASSSITLTDLTTTDITQSNIIKSDTPVSVSVKIVPEGLGTLQINYASIIFIQLRSKFGYGSFVSDSVVSRFITFPYYKIPSINVKKSGISFILLKSGVWQVQYSLLATSQFPNNTIMINLLLNNQLFNSNSETVKPNNSPSQWMAQTNVFEISTPVSVSITNNSTSSVLFSYATINFVLISPS